MPDTHGDFDDTDRQDDPLPQNDFDPPTFHIPPEVEGVRTLLTAREWERAAIVYAYVERQQGRRVTSTGTGGSYSIEEFAALGVAGLRSPDTVRRYLRAWERAVELGLAVDVVKPGDRVDVPNAPWPLPLDPPSGESPADDQGNASGATSSHKPAQPDRSPRPDDYDYACQAQVANLMRQFGTPFQQGLSATLVNPRLANNRDAIANRHREQVEAIIRQLRKLVAPTKHTGATHLKVVD